MKLKLLTLVILLTFILKSTQVYAVPIYTTFAPDTCPEETDLVTHMTNEIDDRLSGIVASNETKSLFTARGDNTGGWTWNSNVWTNATSTDNDTPLDWTGISVWNSTEGIYRYGVLISPRHIAFAQHAAIGASSTISFVQPDGTIVNRVMMDSHNISGTDLTIGILDSDVPEDITHYPIIDSAEFGAHIAEPYGIPMINVEAEDKANILESINQTREWGGNTAYGLVSDGNHRSTFYEGTTYGDSGSPNFFVISGKPIVNFNIQNFFIGPNMFNLYEEINTAMIELGGGYNASVYNLDCFDTYGNFAPTTEPIVEDDLEENTSDNTYVTILEGSDVDDDDFTFSILSGNTNDAFVIGIANSLYVNNSNALDYETTPVFNLIIKITDTNDNFSTSTITINLLDVNESPIFNATSTLSIEENSSNGTVVGSVSAEDEEEDVITYSIVGGNTGNAFAIGSTTGEILVNNSAKLDYEDIRYFNLTIRASDGNSYTNTNIRIDLVNVSDGSGGSSGGGGGGGGGGSKVKNIEKVKEITSLNPSSYVFDRVLQVGSVGDDVRELQKFLNSNGSIVTPSGPGSIGNETDLFGSLTKDALARFQAAKGIVPASGYFGPITKSFISSGNTGISVPVQVQTQTQTNVRDLDIGMSGDDVKALQNILINRGYPIPSGVTGIFGNQTRLALVEYQKSKGILPASGYFGPLTRFKMKTESTNDLWW